MEHEEVSGWWPSERSAKSRLKAFFSRTRSETFTRQQKVDATDVFHARSQRTGPTDDAEVLAASPGKHCNDHPGWSTRTLRISQRKLVRAQKSLPNLFHTSAEPPVEEMPIHHIIPLTLLPPFSKWSLSRHGSRSTADSSVHNLNSLDRLKERSCSDNYSISTTHTSFSSHASYPLHTPDTSFTSTDSCERAELRSPASPTGTSDHHNIREPSPYMATPKKAPRPSPIRTTSLDALAHSSRDHEAFDTQKPLPSAPLLCPLIDEKDRRISTVAPLPEPGHIRKTSARYRCDSRGPATEPRTPTSPGPRPQSIRSVSSSHISETGHQRIGSYSLFPRTPSYEQERSVSGGTPSPLASATAISSDRVESSPKSPPAATAPSMAMMDQASSSSSRTPSPSLLTTKTRTKATTKSSPPFRSKSKRHGLIPLDTKAAAPKPEPTESPSSISSREIDVKPPSPLRLAKAPSRQQVVRQKSTSSLRLRCPPSGPPPNAPLPALPPEALRWVSGPVGTPC